MIIRFDGYKSIYKGAEVDEAVGRAQKAITLDGDNIFTGTNTFEAPVYLGSNAEAVTPDSSDDSSKVATTAFVKDQGYLSEITSEMITTALGFTPYDSSNPEGYQANVIESIKVNNVAQTITSKAVNITVPTKVSDLTNDSGFISGITSTDVTTALGYTPENVGNKVTSLSASSTDTEYPSAKIVYTLTNANSTAISTINEKIPLEATSSNQLADKAFVNSSIATSTADFVGTFDSLAELEAYTGPVTNNDYAFVVGTDSAGNTVYNRYKYTTATTPASWQFEYALNNSSFTAAQWAAINSGITASGVTLLGTALQPNDNISQLTNDAGYITGITSTDVTTALGFTPYDATNPDGFISGITSSDVTTALGYTPYNSTNPDGYISGITSSDVTTALGYTPYNSTNPDGYISGITSSMVITALGYTPVDSSDLATVATTGDYYDLAVKAIPNVAFATSSTAAATVQKEISIPEITELNVGQVVVVQPSITSSATDSTLKLNDFDPYPMRYNGAAISTSTDSIVWSASFVSQFVFDGSYWQFLGHGLDSNTTYSLNYLIDAGSITAGSGTYAITRYSLIMQKPNMTWEKITATDAAYSTGTTKNVNTSGFLLDNGVKFYNYTSNLANGAKSGTSVIQSQSASVDMRYSTNCGGTPAWAIGDYVYLVGTIGADGLFYLDTTTWWTNTLPSTADGKLYIQLGLFLSDAKISLLAKQPIFYHDGTAICEYVGANNKQDLLVSGTNIKTVNNESILGSGNITISVPTVDQVYDGTSVNAQSGVAIAGAGFLTGITSSMIATALGYTPYDGDTNPNGYIVGISGSDVTTALGYTPEDASNKVTSLSASSTDTEYPSAKCVYDSIQASTITTLAGLTDVNISSAANNQGLLYNSTSGKWENKNVLTSVSWGEIGGTLADQTDLQNALNSKTTMADVEAKGYITGITSSDVTTALGYTPYDASNPNGYIIGISSSDVTTALGYTPYNATNPDGYISGITSSMVTTALGYTPYNGATNPNGYISGITSSDVITALGYTPYDSTNPDGYISGITSSDVITALGYTPYNGATNPNGYISGITSSMVTTALGYTPYNSSNPDGYISGITSSDVTTALGYTPYDSTNPDGFISGITSSMVTTALGYTPYDSTNPDGYITGISSSDVTTALGFTPASESALTSGLASKQDTLVSGTNIKTINSTSLLGSGDIAVQPVISSSNKLSSDLVDDTNKTHKFATAAQLTQISTNQTDISAINEKIPSEASSSNQLADKAFVNSSIATNTANFIGTFSNVSELESYTGTITNNDYAFVINSVVTNSGSDWTTFSALDAYNKDLLTNFDYAWVVNGTKFDLYRFDIVNQQWDLKVSNTAKADVTLNTAYNRYKATVSGSTVTWEYEYTLNNSSFTAAQWAAINSGITSSDVALIGTALQPNDNISSLTNDSGYITGITSTDVTTALGYTPYNATNPSGYISSASMAALTDASISSPSNGQILVYDGTSAKWKNQNAPATATWGNITGTLSNQTDLQTALNGKQPTITGAASTVTSSDLTTGRVVISNSSGKIDVSSITSTKLGYLTDVTSNIQVQINGKQDTISGLDTIIAGAEAGATALQPNDNISSLTNDSGYITGITSTDVTTALGYTPYNGATNPNGYISGITSSDVTTALGYTPYNSSNPDGYITGITSSDVTTALGFTPYNSANPDGYITGITSSDVTTALGFTPANASDLSNYVTTSTDQDITGTKTFVGSKKVAFKQSGNSDKLGFTLFTNNNVEKGYLEFNPTNTIDGAPLMTLGNYATSTSGITQVGFRRYSSVSGANGAYNLLTPLIADAKTPFNLTTTYTNFYLPLGFTDGTATVLAAKSGVVDLSSLLSGFLKGITSSDVTTALGYTPYNSTNPNGYITGITSSDVTTALGYTPVNPSSLATVATTGAYSDLTGTPTVDQTYDGTSTNAQSGVAIDGAFSDYLQDYALTSNLSTVAFTGDYSDLTGIPSEMIGATSSTDGTSGLVPAPLAGDEDKFLKGDGTWAASSGGLQYAMVVTDYTL